MAALRTAARALRVDCGTWMWLESEATLLGAASITTGTFVLFGMSRFGWPDDALRPSTRFTLIGVYGWLGLAVLAWFIGRHIRRRDVSYSTLIRLFGHVHLPLLITAITVIVFASNLGVTGIWRVPALLAGVVWMPAMLIRAISVSAGVTLGEAAAIGAIPYASWAGLVGLPLWKQMTHLL